MIDLCGFVSFLGDFVDKISMFFLKLLKKVKKKFAKDFCSGFILVLAKASGEIFLSFDQNVL